MKLPLTNVALGVLSLKVTSSVNFQFVGLWLSFAFRANEDVTLFIADVLSLYVV